MGYHCIVQAAARLAKESPVNFVKRLRHDGLAFFPDSDVERTHHIQEIIDGLLDRGVALCPIELVPTAVAAEGDATRYIIYFGENGDVSVNFDRFQIHLKNHQGIIAGVKQMAVRPIGHAVYWDGDYCYDSSGKWKLWSNDFQPSTFWRAIWT